MLSRRKLCVLTGAAMFGRAAAQDKHEAGRVDVLKETHVFMRSGAPGPAGAVEFISSEMLPGKVVKGAPYSAEAVTESVQTLADGNRITRRSTAAVARDSQGRTRRESDLSGIPALPTEAAPRLAFINDPVSNTHYIVDETNRTVRKLSVRHSVTSDGKTFERKIAIAGPGIEAEDHVRMAPAPGLVLERMKHDKANEKEENLGTREFEGVRATGTRRTITIPAGEIGNDRAIEIVSEQWHSPELQTLVYSRHSDPRMGETSFRLMRISRAEPPPSLFEVPADYKVMEGPATRAIEMKLRK